MPNIKRFMAGLTMGFLQANPKFVESMVRSNLNKRLSVYTPASLQAAIDNNTDLVAMMQPKEADFIRGLQQNNAVRKFVLAYADKITVSNVTRWLAEDLPYMAAVITSYRYPAGINWLEVQLAKAKQQLLLLPGDTDAVKA